MLLEGIILMLTGMGVVFLFLAILVCVTIWSGRIIRKYEEKIAVEAATKQPAK